MHRFRRQVFLTLLCLAVPTIASNAQEVSLQETAYRSIANQEAFKTFVCRLSFEAGASVDRNELISGRFTDLHGTATGRWAKNGDKETFFVDVGETFVITPGMEEGSFNAPFRGGEKVVNSEQRRAFFGDTLGVAHVGDHSEMSDKVAELSPWHSLGRFGSGAEGIPGKSLLANRKLPSPYKNEISRSDDRIKIVSDLGSFSLLHEFSVKQNFLPTHVAVIMDERELHVETIEATEVQGVGWFPRVMIAYERRKDEIQLTSCFRMKIEGFEYRAPTAEELTFTAIGDYQLHGPIVIPSEDMASVAGGASVGPDMLDDLAKAVVEGDAFGRELAKKNSSGHSWFLALSGILFLCAACYLYRRRSGKLR